jgi:hypothetical protein
MLNRKKKKIGCEWWAGLNWFKVNVNGSLWSLTVVWFIYLFGQPFMP